MNILLLGSGGREHALAWKISQSPLCIQLFIAPGNPGTAQYGTNLHFTGTDFKTVKKACHEHVIDMVVIGPEEPLVKGLVNELKEDPSLKHLLIIGPDAHAAQLEGSKAFAKAFMQRHAIPTAAYGEFTAENFEAGIDYIKQQKLPVVLKADGLAAGKGVLICTTHEEAVAEFAQMIKGAKFGAASQKVVVEEFLSGIELSVFALTDGRNYVLLPEAKDYKRIGEKDAGLNTGGMGAVSPVPFADALFMQKVIDRVVKPTIDGLSKESFDYKGFVFFGLIKVGDEPYVIEYNCRMGDPETEVVMPRLQNDLVALLTAAAQEKLQDITIETDPRFATTVMAVSGGYPEDYSKGFAISGLDTTTADAILFQAGTAFKDGAVITSGGRVLCVTAFGNTVSEAVSKSKAALEKVHFEGMYYRKDIGYEFT
jgi:phosphoribosylamine---glycine ligase